MLCYRILRLSCIKELSQVQRSCKENTFYAVKFFLVILFAKSNLNFLLNQRKKYPSIIFFLTSQDDQSMSASRQKLLLQLSELFYPK